MYTEKQFCHRVLSVLLVLSGLFYPKDYLLAQTEDTGTITLINEFGNSVNIEKANGDEMVNGESKLLVPGDTEIKINNVQIGDLFVFSPRNPGDMMGTTFPDFVVESFGETHKIDKQMPQWINRGKTGVTKLVSNDIDPSHFSYDFMYIDPVYIAHSKKNLIDFGGKGSGVRGGMCEKIVQTIGNSSTKYYLNTSGFAAPNHFEQEGYTFSWTESRAETKRSASEFTKSISNNIEVSGGKKGLKASASASFSFAEEHLKDNSKVVTWAKTWSSIYKINFKIKDPDLDLTPDFVDAVIKLPVTYDSLKYMAFIEKWGTSYASSITYGSMLIYYSARTASSEVDGSSFERELKTSLEAETPKGDGSIGLSNKQSESSKFVEQREGFSYIANSIGSENEGSERPIEIKLAPIHDFVTEDLLYRNIKSRPVNAVDLPQIKMNLSRAIDEYADSDKFKKQPTKKYRVKNITWKLKKGQPGYDYANIFGYIRLFVDRDEISTAVTVPTKTMVRPTAYTWYGKKRYVGLPVAIKETDLVLVKENQPQKSSEEYIITFRNTINEEFPNQNSKNGFTIESELINHHPGWINQAGVYGFDTNWESKYKGGFKQNFDAERNKTEQKRLFFVPLKDFKKGSLNEQTFTVSNGDQGTLEISYEVEVLE